MKKKKKMVMKKRRKKINTQGRSFQLARFKYQTNAEFVRDLLLWEVQFGIRKYMISHL